jgi:RHS repeat-associated protein
MKIYKDGHFKHPITALALCCSIVSAEQGAGWFRAPLSNQQLSSTPLDLKSESQKKTAFGSTAAVGENSVNAALQALSSVQIPQEISELAKALGNDPLAIFNWVRNHVDYVHYRGAKKGSLTTLVELSGNDYDQSLLLKDLLAAAGFQAILNHGINWIPYQSADNADIRHWLGLPQAAYANDHADRMLLDRGTKSSEASKNATHIQLKRTWVEATIQGQAVQMDPSFKKYEMVSGMDLVAASAYQRNAILGQLAGTIADGNNSLTNANETAFGNYLKDRATALVNSFKQPANVAKAPLDVTGGWRLQEWNAANLAETFPLGSYDLEAQWEVPPTDRQAALRLRLGTNPQGMQYVLERTLSMSELAGRRLTLEFATNGASTKAQLWLDDTLWGEEPAFVSDASINLEIQMSHPTDPSTASLNQTFQQSYKRKVTVNGMPNGTPIYALVYGFDVSTESLRRRERMLDSYKAVGKTDQSREVMGESLNVIGQQWFLQTQRVSGILSALKGCAPQLHHRIGRVAQEEGAYIDVLGQRSGTLSRIKDTLAAQAVFSTESFYWSAMEHGVLNQLQGVSAASTVGLVSRANALGGKVFVLRDIAAYNAVLSQLSGYSAADRTTFENKINSGATVVCPANADLRLSPSDAWHGAGYVHSSPAETGMIISGGYQGGYSANNFAVNRVTISQSTFNNPLNLNLTPPALFPVLSYDPIDMQTGNFILPSTPDLTVGDSLSFARSYNGALSNRDVAGLGFGWNHSANLYLTRRSSVESALGLRTPTDMAAILVSATAVLDLFEDRVNGTDYQKKWIGSLLAAKWAVDLLKNNGISAHFPDKTQEFIRQPDGSFTPPPGIPVVLNYTGPPENFVGPWQYPDYTYTPRNGASTAFNHLKQNEYNIVSTTDLWGRKISYLYATSPARLTQVTDSFGRSLNLHYIGSRLIGLSDSTGRSVSYNHDAAGNFTGFTDAEGKTDLINYDGFHRITQMKDPSGRTTVINFYDAKGRVIQQHNQGIANRVYFYDYALGVSRETDPTGAVTQYLFDERNRNIGSINALGHRNRIGYDGRDRMIFETSPLGRTSTWTYDANDNVLTSTDTTGAVTTYGYDALNRMTTVTDPLNRVSSVTYNGKHQVVTSINALAEITTNSYDSTTGYLTSTTNSMGHVTSYLYDAYGQMTRTTFADLKFIEQENSIRGDVNWVKDARGIRTDFTYNLRRELTSTTKGGRVTTTAYDDNRMPWRTTNARNFSTVSTFTASEKPLTITGADGAQSSTSYDLRDLPQTSVGPMGETSSTVYDALSRPQITTDPLSRSTTQLYDADGMPTVTQAPLGRNSSVAYQIGIGLPRVTTATNPLGHTSLSEVDAAGQKRFLTNRRGQVFEMRYDALGRVLKTIQPGGRTLEATYGKNATGRTSTLIEPSAQTTTHQHDSRGRILTRTGPDSTTSYTYDGNGNLLTVTEGAAVLTRTYEATRDAVSSYTNAAGDQISYTYDANGNLATLTYPGSRTVTYGYDSSDRLVKVTDWAGRVTHYGYDLSGRLLWLLRPNGTQRRIAYDAAGQETHFTEVGRNGALIVGQSWRYDAGGRAVQRINSPAAVAFSTPSYLATYHSDNRLNTMTPGGGSSTTVVSDLDGNMTSVSLWEPARTWQGASLSWDARNRPTSITTSNGNATYQYDAEGNLISRTQSGQTNRYTVNPSGGLSQQLIEHRADGSKVYYVYGTGLLYEETFSSGNVSQGTRSYHFDQVGSTSALTNDSGTVTGRLEYTAFGVTSHTSGVVDTKYRYNGQYGVQTDLTTGLLQMRARWYSPALGRFLSEDPAGFAGGMNWYSYADGNPISLSDPFGLCTSRGMSYMDTSYSTVSSGYQPTTPASIASALVNASPLVVFKGFYEGSTGVDMFTGRNVSQSEAATNVFLGAFSLGGGAVGAWSKAAFSSSFTTSVGALSNGSSNIIRNGLTIGGGAANSVKPGQTMSAYPQGRVVGGRGESPRLSDPPAGMRESGAWDPTPDNLALMERGRPPVGRDGLPVELHHRNQSPAGPLDQMTSTTHDTIPHPLSPSQINRSQFGGERARYWRGEARTLNGQ